MLVVLTGQRYQVLPVYKEKEWILEVVLKIDWLFHIHIKKGKS